MELPIGIVFDEARTIEGMESAIQEARTGVRPIGVSRDIERAGSDLLHDARIPALGDASDCPLTFSQQRLWFLSQLETNAEVYNMQGAVRLRGMLDVDNLRRVLNAIVHRHDILRACFPVVNGEPVQRFVPALSLPMPVTDLSALSSDAQAEEVQRIAVAEAARPYDLVNGPLIRSRLLKLSDTEHVLLLPKHHLVFDGQSSGILYKEIGELYAAFSKNEPSSLSPLPIQYGDFARWQRQTMAGERLDRNLAFWKTNLANMPPVLEFSADRSRPPTLSYRGNRYWFRLSKDLSVRFISLARNEGATLYIALLAAFQVLLFRYSGQCDFVLVTLPPLNRSSSSVRISGRRGGKRCRESGTQRSKSSRNCGRPRSKSRGVSP